MQAYGPGFARVYNEKWASFARRVAPLIHDYYTSTPIGQHNRSLLDLCCGAGHLTLWFLENGFEVVGVDLSPHMLMYAMEKNHRFVESGRCQFVQADASDFSLDRRFGLVAATYDSLNHLNGYEALDNCFKRVHAVCDGYFVFDLNTRTGLRNWNNVIVNDGGDDSLIITRGVFDDDGERAWLRLTGFTRATGGLYERFDETVFNTVFDLAAVKEMLLSRGWSSVSFAASRDLSSVLEDPESEPRVFVIAEK